MGLQISEEKKQIVINNYFKSECNINTSIKEAYERGFNRGLSKAEATYERYYKLAIISILKDLQNEFHMLTHTIAEDCSDIVQEKINMLGGKVNES